VAGELEARGIPAEAGARLLEFFAPIAEAGAVPAAAHGGPGLAAVNDDALGRAAAFVGAHPQGAGAIAALRQILALAEATPAAGRLRVDPSLARGLSYYTGAIMEVAVADLAGSLGGGGRYDNLVGMFLGQDVPACGFSLGLERIIVVMTERGMFPADIVAAPADVMVTVWSAETMADSLALARALRDGGLRADVYPDADKLGKQFKYASGRAVPFVAILGDDERASGEVAVKDLRTGEQQRWPRHEAAARLLALVNRHPSLVN
jgi:histidyl-tRNA synthetase